MLNLRVLNGWNLDKFAPLNDKNGSSMEPTTLDVPAMRKKRVLVVYYTFTQQTRSLLLRFIGGLEGAGIEVTLERLVPIAPYEYPFRTFLHLAPAMIATLFQRRMAIQPIASHCMDNWDCIVLAGPTWSYNPSGPVLSFLDRYGKEVCGGRKVVPFISCRAYWRLHYWTVRHRLRQYGALVESPVVFTHPVSEPWRSLGLLLKLQGKIGQKRYAWFRRFYPRYGHSDAQRVEAMEQGRQLAEKILAT